MVSQDAMAETLSLAASVIAVIGAAEGVAKTIARIKNIYDAPEIVLALINEVSDLQVILRDVKIYIVRNTQLPSEKLSQLSSLVHRAMEKLLRLDEFIQYRLVKPDSTADQIKVSRREWAMATSKVHRFQQELRDIRLNIITQMLLVNMYVLLWQRS